MDEFVRIVVGGLIIIFVVCGITALAIATCIEMSNRLLDKMKRVGAQEERVRLHRNLLTGAHWFSEHRPTSKLMQEYANRVVQYEESNISEIRDEWRREMKSSMPNKE